MTDSVKKTRPNVAEPINKNDEDFAVVRKRIADRLFDLREKSGMTRQKLAGLVGVSHQQVFKYENYQARIGADKLVVFAKVFGKPLEYFTGEQPYERHDGQSECVLRRQRRLSAYFAEIRSDEVQSAVVDLTRALAQPDRTADETSFCLRSDVARLCNALIAVRTLVFDPENVEKDDAFRKNVTELVDETLYRVSRHGKDAHKELTKKEA